MPSFVIGGLRGSKRPAILSLAVNLCHNLMTFCKGVCPSKLIRENIIQSHPDEEKKLFSWPKERHITISLANSR